MTRILVISNACFSDSDSNGRTLSNLFRQFNPEEIAQFYVYGSPDFNICKNYYRVTDSDVLRSILRCREYGGTVCDDGQNGMQDIGNIACKHKIKKNLTGRLARECVWRIWSLNNKRFNKWVDDFKPRLIFVSLADNLFTIRLAVKIAKKYNIPVIAYSTESYFLKKYNYITKRPSLLYCLFRFLLTRSYKKIEKYVGAGLFNTPMLAEAYKEKYSYPCKCVFNPSFIDYIDNSGTNKSSTLRVSYLGNLGVGRHMALIELANVLAEISEGAKLDIYGKIPNDLIKKDITECPNICYKGFVSYEEVANVMHGSNLLVHAELDDEFYNEDLKYAFSTKIADSVCCGTPFLVYAKSNLAETDFLIKNGCAFVAESAQELREVLRTALFDSDARAEKVSNAFKVKNECFSMQVCSEIMRETVLNTVTDWRKK